MKTIDEDFKRAAQLKNLAASTLAKAKERKRKADTRTKIILGGLVKKAGLGEFDQAVLLGGLMVLCETLHGPHGETRAVQFARKAVDAQTPPTPTAAPVEVSSLTTVPGVTETDQVSAGA